MAVFFEESKHMKKSLVLLAALAVASMSAFAGENYYLQNAGRIDNTVQTYAAVNSNGGSMSHAEGQAMAAANGTVATSPGKVSVTGGVAGFNNGVAYNTVFGSGVGSASSQGWSDATTFGNATSVTPHGSITVAGSADGGMTNPVRNGTDINIQASTAQDGFVNASYNGGFAVNGQITTAYSGGGWSVTGIVQDSKYGNGEVVAGGVTFAGGTPAGQTAAVRYGNSGVTVNASGSFIDPVH